MEYWNMEWQWNIVSHVKLTAIYEELYIWEFFKQLTLCFRFQILNYIPSLIKNYHWMLLQTILIFSSHMSPLACGPLHFTHVLNLNTRGLIFDRHGLSCLKISAS